MGQTSNYTFDGSGVGVAAGGDFRIVQGKYSFAINGGGTGTYALATLPSGTRVLGGWVDVSGTPTAVSGTPTIAIHVQSANDLLTATSVLGAPFSTVGKGAFTPKINTPETNSITLTADRTVTATIATAAISTGIFTVYLEVV